MKTFRNSRPEGGGSIRNGLLPHKSQKRHCFGQMAWCPLFCFHTLLIRLSSSRGKAWRLVSRQREQQSNWIVELNTPNNGNLTGKTKIFSLPTLAWVSKTPLLIGHKSKLYPYVSWCLYTLLHQLIDTSKKLSITVTCCFESNRYTSD